MTVMDNWISEGESVCSRSGSSYV